MRRIILFIITAGLLCACLTFSGCETTANTSSAVKGTGAGAAVGAGVGKNAGNTAVGAVIGAYMGEPKAAEPKAVEHTTAVAEQIAAAERKSAEQKLYTLIKDCYEVLVDQPYRHIRRSETVFWHEKRAGKTASSQYEFGKLWNKDFWYYYSDLRKTYDTELKQKVFANTEEYISLNKELTSFSDMAKRNTYYYLHKKNIKSYYNLKTKSFHFTLYLPERDICECIKFRDIRLSYPSKYIMIDDRYQLQDIQISVLDENIALEIEDNITDCAVLFIFNIENIEERLTVLGDEYMFLGKTKSVHIVNTKSGKVYVQVQVPL